MLRTKNPYILIKNTLIAITYLLTIHNAVYSSHCVTITRKHAFVIHLIYSEAIGLEFIKQYLGTTCIVMRVLTQYRVTIFNFRFF